MKILKQCRFEFKGARSGIDLVNVVYDHDEHTPDSPLTFELVDGDGYSSDLVTLSFTACEVMRIKSYLISSVTEVDVRGRPLGASESIVFADADKLCQFELSHDVLGEPYRSGVTFAYEVVTDVSIRPMLEYSEVRRLVELLERLYP